MSNQTTQNNEDNREENKKRTSFLTFVLYGREEQLLLELFEYIISHPDKSKIWRDKLKYIEMPPKPHDISVVY